MRRWPGILVGMIAAVSVALPAVPASATTWAETPVAAVAGNPEITGNEWTTPTDVKVGQVPARAAVIPFDTVEDAKANPTLRKAQQASDNVRLLNGTWKFNYVEKPADKPNMAGVTAIPAQGYQDIVVPSSWQVAGKYAGALGTDFPVYNNQDYAFQAVGDGKTNPGDFEAVQAPTAYNPVGTYMRTLELSADDIANQRQILTFMGVEAGFYLYVNGAVVGYGEDSFSSSEFDITDYVHEGTNTLTVQVYRWTTGTFVENQDGLNYSGIHRDVFLTLQPEAAIYDYNVETVFPNHDYAAAELQVSVDVANVGEASVGRTVTAHLYDEAGQQVGQSLAGTVTAAAGETGKVTLSGTVTEPKLWSAEHPNLYTLILELADGSTTVQTVGKRIGFRDIYVANAGTSNSTSNIKVNGQNIEIYGTNRGESDPAYGHHIPYEVAVQHMKNFKLLNINAVRSSHYPPDAHFIELADEFGIYVMNEVNNESHNGRDGIKNDPWAIDPTLTSRDFPGNDSRYTKALVQRTTSMVMRDKNNASVVMYSLGNEAGTGPNFENMITTIKTLDGEKLIHYQGDNGNARLDMIGSFYPEYAKANAATSQRPAVLSEYQHAMGNTGGAMDKYVSVFEGSYRQQGGFLWEYNDHSAWTLKPGVNTADGVTQDELYLGFDGSWKQHSGDGNFQADGFIYPDRTIKPMGDEIRAQYQGLKFLQSAQQREAKQFTLRNLNRFTNANEYAITWSLLENGVAVQEGTYTDAEVDLAPPTGNIVNGVDKTIAIPYQIAEPKAGAEYQVRIEYALKSDAPYADAGHVQGSGQFAATEKGADVTVDTEALDAVTTQNTATAVTVSGTTPTGKPFQVSIDKASGTLKTYKADGKDLITKAPVGSFFRAETDQSAAVKGLAHTKNVPEAYDAWLDQGEKQNNVSVRVLTGSEGMTKVAVQSTLNNGSKYSTSYSIYGDGAVKVDATLTPSEESPEQLGEFGMMMNLPGEFENMQWYGRGPGETYWDRKAGDNLGLWTSTVTDRFFPYMRIQETGNTTDVRWLALTDDDGTGLLASMAYGEGYSGNPLEAVALHYTPKALSTFNTKKLFPHEAEVSDDVILRLLTHQKGVGNFDWGHEPPDAMISKRDSSLLSYSYTLKPLLAGDDPTQASKSIYSELALPLLESIDVDGLEVPNFDPMDFDYDFAFPPYYPEGTVPVVSATAGEGVDVRIDQPTSVPGTATIHVGPPENAVDYTININYTPPAPQTVSLTDLIQVPTTVSASGATTIGTPGVGNLLYAYSGYREIFENRNIAGKALQTVRGSVHDLGFAGNSQQIIDVDISDKRVESFSAVTGIDIDKAGQARATIDFQVWAHKDASQLTSSHYSGMNPGAAGTGTTVKTGWTKIAASGVMGNTTVDYAFNKVPLTYVDGNGETKRYQAIRLVMEADANNGHDQGIWGSPVLTMSSIENPEFRSVSLDGAELPGFSPEVTDYTVELASGAALPQLAVDADEGIFVNVKQAKSVPGTATVRVGAATYTIRFERAQKPAGQQVFLSDLVTIPGSITEDGADQSSALNGNLLYAYSAERGIFKDRSQGVSGDTALRLRESGEGDSAVIKEYEHGFAGNAQQVLDIDISGKDAVRFTADVGIDWTLEPDSGPASADGPAVQFEVWGAKKASALNNGFYAGMAPTPTGGTLATQGWEQIGDASPLLSNAAYTGSLEVQRDLHRFDLDTTYVDGTGAKRSYEAIRLVSKPLEHTSRDQVVWGDPQLTFLGDELPESVTMLRLTATVDEALASIGYLLDTEQNGTKIRSIAAVYAGNRLIGLNETTLNANDGNQDGDLPVALPEGTEPTSLAYLLINADGSLSPVSGAWRADAVSGEDPFSHSGLRAVLPASDPQFEVAVDAESKQVSLTGTGFSPGAVLVVEAKASDVDGVDHIAFVTADGRGVLDYNYESNSASTEAITVKIGGQGLEKPLSFPEEAPEPVLVDTVAVGGDGIVDGAVSLKKGSTLALTATVLPENADDKSVTWDSDSAEVATVDADGTVTALTAGTATISASANDESGVTGQVTVTVTEETPPVDPEPEAVPTTTTVKLSKSTLRLDSRGEAKTSAAVTVRTKKGTPVSGKVVVKVGSSTVNATVRGGKATVPLTATRAGSYSIQVSFVGTDSAAPSSAKTTWKVLKATSSVKVDSKRFATAVKKAVRNDKKKVQVRVAVKIAGTSKNAAGKLSISGKGISAKSVRFSNGKAVFTVTLTKSAVKSVTLKVAYKGTSKVESATAKVVVKTRR